MRRPIIDWNHNDFMTQIDGREYRIVARLSMRGYLAKAYFQGKPDEYFDEVVSDVSIEDAILKMVKLLEK